MPLLLDLIVPIAVQIIKSYIESSSSKKDDLILSTVKEGCSYLAPKDNNDVNYIMSAAINSASMKEGN